MCNLSSWYLGEILQPHQTRGALDLPVAIIIISSVTLIYTVTVSHYVLSEKFGLRNDECFRSIQWYAFPAPWISLPDTMIPIGEYSSGSSYSTESVDTTYSSSYSDTITPPPFWLKYAIHDIHLYWESPTEYSYECPGMMTATFWMNCRFYCYDIILFFHRCVSDQNKPMVSLAIGFRRVKYDLLIYHIPDTDPGSWIIMRRIVLLKCEHRSKISVRSDVCTRRENTQWS